MAWLQDVVIEWPWSPAAALRRRAHAALIEARLAAVQDQLAVSRRIQGVWDELQFIRATEAARSAMLELRGQGEAARLQAAFRHLVQLTGQFATVLETLERFRAMLGDDILDAVRERALNEFASRVATAMRGDDGPVPGGGRP